MKVFYNKLPKEWFSASWPNYVARAVDTTGKWEFVNHVQSFDALPKFIGVAEKVLKEQCTEVVFHNGLWTKTREEIIAIAPEAFYGFPHGAVSASKVGGNDLTVGERPEP